MTAHQQHPQPGHGRSALLQGALPRRVVAGTCEDSRGEHSFPFLEQTTISVDSVQLPLGASTREPAAPEACVASLGSATANGVVPGKQWLPPQLCPPTPQGHLVPQDGPGLRWWVQGSPCFSPASPRCVNHRPSQTDRRREAGDLRLECWAVRGCTTLVARAIVCPIRCFLCWIHSILKGVLRGGPVLHICSLGEKETRI